jgi:hypothetical protein
MLMSIKCVDIISKLFLMYLDMIRLSITTSFFCSVIPSKDKIILFSYC